MGRMAGGCQTRSSFYCNCLKKYGFQSHIPAGSLPLQETSYQVSRKCVAKESRGYQPPTHSFHDAMQVYPLRLLKDGGEGVGGGGPEVECCICCFLPCLPSTPPLSSWWPIHFLVLAVSKQNVASILITTSMLIRSLNGFNQIRAFTFAQKKTNSSQLLQKPGNKTLPTKGYLI